MRHLFQTIGAGLTAALIFLTTMAISRTATLPAALQIAMPLPPVTVAETDNTPATPPQTPPTPRQKSLEQITYDIQYLASDEMAGRQPGTPGIKLAEEYIVGEYKKAGLNPLEDGTYFQELEVGDSRSCKSGSATLVLIAPDGEELKLTLGDNYQQLISRSDFDHNAELVFVGYGISAEEHNYDEYDGIDVKDKIVVLLRNEPQTDDAASVFDGTDNSRHAAGRTKVTAARRAGAAGILMINDDSIATDDERDALIQEDRFGNLSLPFAQIKRNVFSQLLKKSPLRTPTGKKLKTIGEIEALIDANLEPLSQKISGWTASFKCEFETKKIKTSNIVGIIEGEGPHAEETIIIGAHYDHLGDGAYGSRAGGRREIHNGADDNATGVAGVLELARRINGRDKKPGRRLVFICFTAEEMGLLGAFYYVENPIYPLKQTVAMVNFDMIGWLRDDKLTIYNGNSSPQFNSIFESANKDGLLNLELPSNPFAGSDHLPFHQKSVPNMFIHTGLNEVYHTPEDDFEAINCEGALRVIEFSESVVDELASLNTRPAFGRPEPFRLGVILESKNDVVTITKVLSDSIADKSGIQAGDIVLEVEGSKIVSRRAVTRIVRRDRGKTIRLKLKRGDQELDLDVELK